MVEHNNGCGIVVFFSSHSHPMDATIAELLSSWWARPIHYHFGDCASPYRL